MRFVNAILFRLYTILQRAMPVLWPCIRLFRRSTSTPSSDRVGRGTYKTVQKAPLWIHCASLGEAHLALLIKQSLEKHRLLTQPPFISCVTQTAHAYLRSNLPLNRCGYAPFDHPRYLQRALEAVQPKATLFIENERWPHWLQMASSPLAINSTLSPQTERAYKKWGLAPYCLHPFQAIATVSDNDRTRICALGYPDAHCTTLGPLKLLQLLSKPATHPQKKSPLVALVSSHPGEEYLFIQAMQSCMQHYPQLRCAIAPRHPERFAQVFTEIGQTVALRRWDEHPQGRWLLFDKMGELSTLYQQSHIVLIGGSFVPGIGGHNLAEPLPYGCHIGYGPHIERQQPLHNWLQEHALATQIAEVDLATFITQRLTACPSSYQKALQHIEKMEQKMLAWLTQYCL